MRVLTLNKSFKDIHQPVVTNLQLQINNYLCHSCIPYTIFNCRNVVYFRCGMGGHCCFPTERNRRASQGLKMFQTVTQELSGNN